MSNEASEVAFVTLGTRLEGGSEGLPRVGVR